MTKWQLNAFVYRQPWECPWNPRLLVRKGLYIQLITPDFEGWGEIAPLPGFSHESLKESWLSFKALMSGASIELPPSVEWGLSCAQRPALKSDIEPHSGAYPLLLGSDEDIRRRLDTWQGVLDRAKLKVGRGSLDDDIRRVNWLHQRYPEMRLRLDANEHWSLQQAQAFFDQIPVNALEYLEQPCARYEDCLQLADRGCAVALDESLQRGEYQLPDLHTFKALVLKPMLLGKATLALLEAARVQKVNVSISSSYETDLGIAHLQQLAADAGDAAPGLDTLKAFRGEKHLRKIGQWAGEDNCFSI